MEIKGKLVEKFPTQEVTDTFKKQEFVIEFVENPQYSYSEFLKFEMIQDKCGQIDSHEIGSELIVSFNLKGRKWNDPQGETKYFNTLQAWRLQAGTPAASSPSSPSSPSSTSSAPATGGMDQQKEPTWNNDGEGDAEDLPF